jgi:hypothetical protein
VVGADSPLEWIPHKGSHKVIIPEVCQVSHMLRIQWVKFDLILHTAGRTSADAGHRPFGRPHFLNVQVYANSRLL